MYYITSYTIHILGYAGVSKEQKDGIADKWFESQRKFYVDIGKAFGDQVDTSRG